MIMAWQRSPAGSLPCYSFGGEYRDCHDVRIARQVAHACGQSHQVIRLEQEFLARFPHYAERAVYLTDGCVSVSHCPDLYLNEHAAAIAPVRMTGNYGGEVLRGVRAFKPVKPAAGVFAPELLPHLSAAADTYRNALRTHPVSFAVFRQAPWHHYGLFALEQTQVASRSPFLDNEFVRTAFRAPQAALQTDDVCMRLIAAGNPALAVIRTDRGLGPAQSQFSRAISTQLREFTFKAEYAYDYGMPQSLARIDRVFSSLHLERLFLGRHKFSHFRVWYRDRLSDYVRETLLDSRALSRPYLQPKSTEAIVQAHLRGDRNYTTVIHKLLTLELLHRLFIDSAVETAFHHDPAKVLAASR
jgi:asparagine synthase (glutamine-hydrolysing)